MILGRRTAEPAAGSEPEAEPPTEPVGKGRPTPKRSEARKARRNVTPRNRKEAAALSRDKAREQRRLAREALQTGDERYLPPRDAGPERRLARDVVDTRFTLGQAFFGVIVVALVLSFVQNTVINFVSTVLALLALTGIVLDSARNGRRAKNAVTERFGAKEARGISSYAFMRSFLPRRFRRPPPKLNRGDPLR